MDGSWAASTTSFFAGLPGWKRAAFGTATMLLFGGLGLKGVTSLSGEGPETAGATSSVETASSVGTSGEERSTMRLTSNVDERAKSSSPTAYADGLDEEPEAPYGDLSTRSMTPGWPPTGHETVGAEVPSGDYPYGSPTPRSSVDLVERPGDNPYARSPLDDRAESSTLDDWGPSLMMGGFSFFAAFCIGYALRTFAKISLIVLGLLFSCLAAMSYGDYIVVNWDRIAAQFDHLVSFARMEFGGFNSFLQKSLPSAAMAGLGLITGLKKK